MLGYALGDINVQTAVTFARGVRTAASDLHVGDAELVFLNRLGPSGSAAPDPRSGVWEESIVDAPEIIDFLEEIVARREVLRAQWDAVRATVATIVSDSTKFEARFVDNQSYRKQFIGALKTIPALLSAELSVDLVQKALSTKAQKAGARGGFQHYEGWLDGVLDVLVVWPMSTLPPALFEYIGRELKTLAHYIEPDNAEVGGFAWEATKLWHRRKGEIVSQPALLDALRTYAEREHAYTLRDLLRRAS